MKILGVGRVGWVVGALTLVCPVGSARAECWLMGPGHGVNGRPAAATQSATMWDMDGAGPLAPVLVVGGYDGVRAWIGAAWVPVGGSGSVHAVTVYNGQLYAAGTFGSLGSDQVGGVARWDGAHWVPLGSGLTTIALNNYGHVDALEVWNGVLYLGGVFKPIDLGAQVNEAAWNGSGWLNVTQTLTPIADFTILNSQLYACTTGISGVAGIYRYDAGDWTRIGANTSGSVRALTSYNGELIAGGAFAEFYAQPTVLINGVARWNGTAWVQLGDGVTPLGEPYGVSALTVYNGQLIVGGVLETAGGQAVKNIAAWNGTSWSPLGAGLEIVHGSGGVEDLTVYNNELVAMGYITAADGLPANNIVRWNASEWLPFLEGINGPVRAFLPAGPGLYAGGDFAFSWQPDAMNHVLGSDSTTIDDPISGPGGFSGVDGRVNALALHSFDLHLPSHLIVGGYFTSAGGVTAANIADHDPLLGDWQQLGGGFNNAVTALADFNRTLFAAGIFTASGATPLPHLAKYSSGVWVSPGAWTFSPIYALALSGSSLLIGGVNGGSDGVSSWDGAILTPYGVADGPVFALTTYNGDVIAGGNFTTIGGQAAMHVARRDATTGLWSAMGSGLAMGNVYALAVHNGQLYAGGSFITSGGTNVYRLAQWTGGAWADVNGGLDGPVYAMTSFNGALHVGGDFNESGDRVISPYWIEYGACVLAVDAHPGSGGLALSASYPNPARSLSRITFSLEHAGHATLAIHDVVGRVVRTLEDRWYESGAHTAVWDGADDAGRSSPAGMYFYRLEANGRTVSRRVVLIP